MVNNLTDADIHGKTTSVLQKVIYKTASLDHITQDTRLQEDLDMDSVRVVDLVLGLEDEFGIRIEDDTIERIKTVRDLNEMVKSKLR